MHKISQQIRDTISFFSSRGTYVQGKKCIRIKVPDNASRHVFTVDIPDPEFAQPAATFQKKHDLENIARHYVLPEGIGAGELQAYALLVFRSREITPQERFAHLDRVWEKLCDDNPELLEIKYPARNDRVLFDLIMGVASAYNVTDIQFFLDECAAWQANKDLDPPALKMSKSEKYIELTSVFNKYAARRAATDHVYPQFDMHWVAAPETLQSIQDQLSVKFIKPRDNPPAR